MAVSMNQMTRKTTIRTKHWTFIIIITILVMTQSGTIANRNVGMTSRPIITVHERDQGRQLTTYHVVDNDVTSRLEFGFPPENRRIHATERMELFYKSLSSQETSQNDVIRTTLRHPWYDVYMTSDETNRVRACLRNTSVVSIETNEYVCPENHDVFLERWNVNKTCSDDVNSTSQIPYKIRFGDHVTQIAYANVNDVTWELNADSQNALIIQALAHAAKRAWEESLNALFSIQVSRFKIRRKREKRRGRKKRCVLSPIEVRDQLVSEVTIDELKRDFKINLKTNRKCSGYNLRNLVRKTSWGLMTFDAKAALACSINHVTKEKLGEKLLGLADTKCVRKKKWGRLSEKRRKQLLDDFLRVKWMRHRPGVVTWLIKIMDSYMDEKTTTFCLQEN